MCFSVCTSPYKPFSHEYSYAAELLSPPQSSETMRLVSGPGHFSRSLYAAAQVTRCLFFQVLISIPFTAILLNSSVSSMCLRELCTDSVWKPWRGSRWHKHIDNWKRCECLPTVLLWKGPQLVVLSSASCCRMEKMLKAWGHPALFSLWDVTPWYHFLHHL